MCGNYIEDVRWLHTYGKDNIEKRTRYQQPSTTMTKKANIWKMQPRICKHIRRKYTRSILSTHVWKVYSLYFLNIRVESILALFYQHSYGKYILTEFFFYLISIFSTYAWKVYSFYFLNIHVESILVLFSEIVNIISFFLMKWRKKSNV